MVRSLVEEPAIAEVAVNVPLGKLFHYRVPGELRGRIARGHRVLIPFGKRTTTGVCVGFPASAPVAELKPIREILHPECRFDAHLLELTRWIAAYYRAPWGEVLEAALPPAIRAGKRRRGQRTVSAVPGPVELQAAAERLGKRAPVRARLLRLLAESPGPHPLPALRERLAAGGEAVRAAVRALSAEGLIAEGEGEATPADPFLPDPAPAAAAVPEHALSEEQGGALRAIEGALERGGFAPFLLHGVTGSGKTEIYIRALRRAAELGGAGLVLVPEIALTPQTVRRFRAALPGLGVAVLHSMLTPRQRAAEWRAIQEGRAQAAIGARSAVFAPFPRLRVIIVDEEHEPSYKQESAPRYHARDVAVMRARMLGVPVVLGSATPSLESYHNARADKYRLLVLPRRVTPHDLPAVQVVELGPDFYRPDGTGLISEPLDRLIRARLERREQVLLFLNRRGFATFIHCLRCRFVLKCSACDVALTFHRQSGTSQCHLCDARTAAPGACPGCGLPGLRRSGAGTERVIAEIHRRYPEARTARLDSDAVSGHRALQSILDRFARGEIDILAGTQMIAKGHDFPQVSLVGIICADSGLHLPDFRAAERTFQLVTQVAGRAGRGERPGRVVVQTFAPGHYALRRAIAGDYAGFFDEEAGHRRVLGYPPFGRAARVLVQGEEEARAREAARRAGEALRGSGAPVEVLGPAAAPIARIQDRYRFQILLKGKTHAALRAALAALPPRPPAGADLIVDIDPHSLL